MQGSDVDFLGEKARNFAVIMGVVIAIWSLRTTIILARRKQSSDLVFSARNDENFVAGIRALRAHRASDNVELLAVHPGIKSADAASLRYILNYFEALAVGARNGIYDEKILYLNYRTTLIHVFDAAIPFIREVRISQNNATLYKELSWLAMRWKRAENSIMARLCIDFDWRLILEVVSRGRIRVGV